MKQQAFRISSRVVLFAKHWHYRVWSRVKGSPMESQVVEGNSLPYVLVKPPGFQPGAGWPLVVLVHGRGASMYDLAGLAPAIDAAGYVYAFPNGPYSFYGMGQSWVAGQPGVEPVPEGAPSITELFEGFMAEVIEQTGVEAGNIVLGGFSQGGGVTLRFGLPRPEMFKGLMVLSGAFREAGEVDLPATHTQPIFVVHGTNDQVLEVDMGRRTRAYLEQEGYPVSYHEYPMAHEITPAVIRDLVPWLHETLPPKA
jgi:phospholipase/carboxylesterase